MFKEFGGPKRKTEKGGIYTVAAFYV